MLSCFKPGRDAAPVATPSLPSYSFRGGLMRPFAKQTLKSSYSRGLPASRGEDTRNSATLQGLLKCFETLVSVCDEASSVAVPDLRASQPTMSLSIKGAYIKGRLAFYTHRLSALYSRFIVENTLSTGLLFLVLTTAKPIIPSVHRK
jgi:hypothetical protein